MNTRQSKELQIGKAGEYLVCADIILKGMIGFLSEQGLPYDVLIDTGEKLLKCQVKTTEGLRIIPQKNKETKAYIFNIKRHGTNAQKRYTLHEVDVFALVCLDTKKIGYILNKEMPSTINLRSDKLRYSYYDEKGLIDYTNVIELDREGFNQKEISETLHLHFSTVSRMLKPGYKPHITKAIYFSDIIRGAEWFLKI